MHHLFYLCLLGFVIEIYTLKLYVINTNDGAQLKLIDNIVNILNTSPRDDLRSKFDNIPNLKALCRFGSIFANKAHRLCMEYYYANQNFPKENNNKRKRKQGPQPAKKPFIDLTRGLSVKAFASDYLDLKDFARSMDDEFSKDYLDVGDLQRDDFIQDDLRRSLPYETKLNKNPKGTKFKSEYSDSNSESSDDSDDNTKRFEVVENKSSDNGDSSGSESSEEKPKKLSKKEPKYVYFQGRNRHVKNVDGRRRLQHFLPKRFHWDADEIKKLGYYWFDGPRGRFAEALNAFKK